MEEIPIAYPILDQSNQISITNIIFDVDYDFVIKYKVDEYIEITLKYSYMVYQQLITKSDLPLDKLYKLIINSLNKEPNYLIDIKLDNDINLGIQFNSDMIDINKQIILIRQSNTKPTEILLLEKIKELENKLSICHKYINKKICINGYYFDINTEDLDLSNSDSISCYDCLENTMHKFTNIKTISLSISSERIIHILSFILKPIKENDDYRNNIHTIYLNHTCTTCTCTSSCANIILRLISLFSNFNNKNELKIIFINANIEYFIDINDCCHFQPFCHKEDEKFSACRIDYKHILSNSNINYKIIFKNTKFNKKIITKYIRTDTHVEEIVVIKENNTVGTKIHYCYNNKISVLSNFQEFITGFKLDKYNIFYNV